MKTKELIRMLQVADPSGELECCIDNKDIVSIYRERANRQGPLEVLITDSKVPYWNCHSIVGAKIIFGGEKICINAHSIEQAIMDDPTLDVDLSEDSTGDYSKKVKSWRKNSWKVIKEIDKWYKSVMAGKEFPLGE